MFFVPEHTHVLDFPMVKPMLDIAETDDRDVSLASIPPDEATIAKQLAYCLVMLTKGRALDKVQSAGNGEGLMAWRLMCTQWEPKTKMHFVHLLMELLASKFNGDSSQIQTDIETLERKVRV